MLPWKLRKRHILPVNQYLSSVYFSLAKLQLVSCNLSLAMIWQMTYTRKVPKLCSATLRYHNSGPEVKNKQYTLSNDTCYIRDIPPDLCVCCSHLLVKHSSFCLVLFLFFFFSHDYVTFTLLFMLMLLCEIIFFYIKKKMIYSFAVHLA